jgi:hypothetical protein
MANLFDVTNYPTREPVKVQAGDRWAWRKTAIVTDYPPSAYSLSYIFRREITGERLSVSATGTTEGYVVEVSSTVTEAYPPGRYQWTSYITRTSDSQRVEYENGSLEIKPDRATSSADPRSFAQVALDNIEAFLKDPNNLNAASYSIAGRSLSRYSLTELHTLRDKLKGEVLREKQAEDIAKGLGTSQTIRVRFGPTVGRFGL